MLLRLVTDSQAELMDTAAAKAHLRVDHALDDGYIDTLTKAARLYLEKLMGRSLINQAWEGTCTGFPCFEESEGILLSAFHLPKGQLQSVASVQYLDVDGVLQTLASTVYDVENKRTTEGRIILAYQQVWPVTRWVWNAVTLNWTSGYGTNAASVPAPIVHAAKILIASMYELRVMEVTGTIISKVGFSVDALCAPYRLMAGS